MFCNKNLNIKNPNEFHCCKAFLLLAHKTTIGCNNNGFPRRLEKNNHVISPKLKNINKIASNFFHRKNNFTVYLENALCTRFLTE